MTSYIHNGQEAGTIDWLRPNPKRKYSRVAGLAKTLLQFKHRFLWYILLARGAPCMFLVWEPCWHMQEIATAA
jgi:hypothetical protein